MRAFLSGIIFVILSITTICAQEVTAQRLFFEGDTLRRAYRFEEAIEVYREAMIVSSDTLFKNRAEFNTILCENGLNMLQYAVDLKTLGSAKIPRESFYLYLNLDPYSFWALPPEGLFQEISEDYPVFVSPIHQTVIFTGRPTGSQNLSLYISHQASDSLWSYPILMESTINSTGNECYPILSADGQTLWFASDGHYGMGGFDLYVSYFNKESETWSQAQNMGFPFSSVGHDLAFMSAPDGLSAYIVSDRGGDGLSLNLYKVEYELNPERHDWRDRQDLPLLAQLYLAPQDDAEELVDEDATSTTPQSGLDNYTMLVQSAKKIRDEVTAFEKKLAGSRDVYARLFQDEDRLALASRIEDEELMLMDLREKYRLAGVAVQRVEMEFLNSGIIPSIEIVPTHQPEPDAIAAPFVPLPGRLGSLDAFLFAAPMVMEDPIDISFRVEKLSQIIPQEVLPDYLFYRIQLSVSSAPEKPSTFKGICPVFETQTSTGKYLYAAGQFDNHAEASRALTQIQRLGLRGALIIAYYQGKSVTVATARQLETTVAKITYRLSLGSYPRGLPETLSIAVKEISNKDLARISGEGGAKYVVGPFNTMQEAQAVQRALNELGFEGIFIEIINP